MKQQTAVGAITIPPALMMGVLAVPAVLLLAVSLTQNIFYYQVADPDPAGKIWLLEVNFEQSVYTYYSSALHLGIAALLLVTAMEKWRLKEPFLLCWVGLAATFLCTSMDETLALHERLEKIGALIDGQVAPGAGWVIPVALACLLGLLIAIPFLRTLPKPIAALMLAAAAIFIGGAAGLEMLEGEIFFREGLKQSFGAEMFATAEEAMEVAGLLLFLHAILLYRRRHMLRLAVRIG
jgi:hypothetical protein